MGLIAATFEALSRARGARSFHPRGEAFEAAWEPLATTSFATTGLAEDRRAVARLSRAVGLPDGVPDLLGIAIKVLDAHGEGADQDLLMASVVSARMGRHVLWPARDFTAATFSSVLPYEVGRRRVCLVARVEGPDGTSSATLRSTDALELAILLDDTDGRRLARIRVGHRLDPQISEDLRFDPWHAGNGMRPVGIVNRLRRPAYRASQAGRDAPRDGARDRVSRTPGD